MTDVLIVLLLLAHSWYPPQCCADKDCKEVPCSEIARAGNVYLYHEMSFPSLSHAYSPDGKCHVCVYGKIPRCIFTPLPAGA